MAHWLHGRPAGFCSDSILNTSQKGQKWRRREGGARSWWKRWQKLHELVVLGHELCRGRIYVLSRVIWSYSVKDRVSVSGIHTKNQSHRGSGDRKLQVSLVFAPAQVLFQNHWAQVFEDFWGTCTNVCPRTDPVGTGAACFGSAGTACMQRNLWVGVPVGKSPRSLELKQSQNGRENRQESPQWPSENKTVSCLKQSHGRCLRLWSRGHYDQVGPNLSEADCFRIF